MINW